jgi:hypothetical protein
LLVLLQEPLWNHPWAESVDAVISGCATLKMLHEGIWVASNGTLSLIEYVSVIDRWPLLPKVRHTELERTNPEKMRRLDRLVFQAILAKKSDAILCMGKVRNECVGLRITRLIIQEGSKEFLEPYLTQLLYTARNAPEVVYSIHPSHSANYKTGDCLKLRDDVLTDRAPAKARDIEIIHTFLDVVVRMCFPNGSILLVCSIRADQNAPKSYFAFTGPQIYDLRHSLICEDTTHTAKSNARKLLMPIFLRLNATLMRVSYFLVPDLTYYRRDGFAQHNCQHRCHHPAGLRSCQLHQRRHGCTE